jgi:FAD:protein FMN transferase
MTSPEAAAPVHRFADEAMNTTFEIFIAGEPNEYARQAAAAAFEELQRLHLELNRYDPTSDISQINALKGGERIRVSLATFECLKAAAQANAETGGAFDPTIGALLACWRNKDKTPRTPTDTELAAAKARTGMHLVELVEDDHSVGLRADGVRIDLGGVGKGFAVDRMMAILREWSIKTALVHGGRSSILAMGAPPPAPAVGDERGWKLAIRMDTGATPPLGYVYLKDRSLSGSAEPAARPHIIDPRKGRPAEANVDAWVVADTAALTDCLSTAFVVMSPEESADYCKRHPGVSAMLLPRGADRSKTIHLGTWETLYEPRPQKG